MTAAYRALLAEGDRYLEEAQGLLAVRPAAAAAHAALASALYARSALEKPDLLSMLATMKPPNVTPTPAPAPEPDPVAAAIDRHPAGKKRATRRPAGGAQ